MANSSMLLLLLFCTCIGFSSAAVYTVGDKEGWTTIGTPNYTAWAAKETFHVGDTILFVYNVKYHNVIEVNKADYDACVNASAIATYTTGNDSITIKIAGDHYYLCGITGHCDIGQKVKISTASDSAPPAPTPASSSGKTPTPPSAPTSDSSSPSDRKGLGLVAFALVIAAGAIAI